MKKIIFFLCVVLMSFFSFSNSNADDVNIGVVPAYDFDSETGEVSAAYQQNVWRGLLRGFRMFETSVLSEDELNSVENLATYSAVFIPSARAVMTEEQLGNLKSYVKGGGILIRETHSVNNLDQVGKGYYIPDEFDFSEFRASRDFIDEFWRELAGAERVGHRGFIFIEKARFNHDIGIETLLMGLPGEFSPVETEWSINNYYKIAGGTPLLEVKPAVSEDEDGKLPDVIPVLVLNEYGEGYCLSFGLNIRYMRHGGYLERFPPSVYRDLFANLMFWISD